MQKISTCLWFDCEAEEAAAFYTSVFKNSKMHTVARYPKCCEKVSGKPAGSVMTAEFEIEGQWFLALNGGPIFHVNPSISFFVHCRTADEVDALWEKLAEGGKVMMELGEYPYSKRYGWVADKFGVTWQLMLSDEDQPQKIVPCMLFVNDLFGKAGEAMKHYLSVFPDSKEVTVNKAGPVPHYANPDAIMYALFTLSGQYFSIMDGPGKHEFEFNLGVSFVINCETQKEVDMYWDKLTADGGEESVCGWLKDKYGVSWQVTPNIMSEWMRGKDQEKTERAMAAMLTMKKLDIAELERAAEGK